MTQCNDSRLPGFYANAERSSTTCRVEGCEQLRVRGISVCPTHEHMYDSGDWPRSMDGWQMFLDAAAAALPRTEKR